MSKLWILVTCAAMSASSMACAKTDYGTACADDLTKCDDYDGGSLDDATFDGGDSAVGTDTRIDVGDAKVDVADGADGAETGVGDTGKDGCTPITCAASACGSIDDGCGGTVTCSTCPTDKTCDSTTHACVCKPITTCPAGLECGDVPDGCGSTFKCPACTSGKTCNTTSNKCETTCTPATSCTTGKCGTIDNGCGTGTITCAACTSPQTCGGGGTTGICGCTPTGTCGAKVCGTVPDGCGGTINCGTLGGGCPSGTMCNSSGACVCVPGTCGTHVCGTMPDGCGGTLTCGTLGGACSGTLVCSGGFCADPCAGITCTATPAAICTTSTAKRTYAAGVCSGGTCSYAPTDTPCGSGQICSLGACVTPPPSCSGGLDGTWNCGPTGTESCCASLPVTGGAFKRSYDNVSYTDASFVATVADFKLDKYEVTVGRFRKFVNAVVGGYVPPAGSGKHTHLSGGAGLNGSETGWDSSWNALLPTTKATWDGTSNLACDASSASWTSAAGANEKLPIGCATWTQLYAFCIWDGGFLPSEAEWNYAAAGGAEQRAYPWSVPPTSVVYDATYATGCGSVGCLPSPVGSLPKGNGKYGQSDLASNLFEWTLDWFKTTYNETSCTNCSLLTSASATDRAVRGGAYIFVKDSSLTSARNNWRPSTNYYGLGGRCARLP